MEVDNKVRISPPLTELESIKRLLKDATSNKLSDRNVMIPITTKAFVEGRLMPTKTTMMKNDSQEKEQVIVKLSDEYLAEMCVNDACAYIERRMKDLRPLAKDSTSCTTKPKGSLKMKKGFLNNKDSKNKTQNKLQEKKNPIKQNDYKSENKEPMLPFMDIVEEYDESGNQVKAEALDVSKQLIDFQRKMKGDYQNGETKEASHTESVAANLTEFDVDSVDQQDRESNEEVPTITQSYEEISARLDELALLEAEEEMKKDLNLKSSKTLQGKGWKQGFLSNKSSKTHDKKKNTNVTKVKVPSNAEKISTTDASWNSANVKESTDDRERKVQFSNDHQVKEIPRIGTKSIQDVMGPPRPPPESTRNIISPQDLDQIMMKNVVMSPSTDVIGPSKETKPVSMGGVVERQNVTSDMNTISEDNQPKKLSRFAQRRQQMR